MLQLCVAAIHDMLHFSVRECSLTQACEASLACKTYAWHDWLTYCIRTQRTSAPTFSVRSHNGIA